MSTLGKKYGSTNDNFANKIQWRFMVLLSQFLLNDVTIKLKLRILNNVLTWMSELEHAYLEFKNYFSIRFRISNAWRFKLLCAVLVWGSNLSNKNSYVAGLKWHSTLNFAIG